MGSYAELVAHAGGYFHLCQDSCMAAAIDFSLQSVSSLNMSFKPQDVANIQAKGACGRLVLPPEVGIGYF